MLGRGVFLQSEAADETRSGAHAGPCVRPVPAASSRAGHRGRGASHFSDQRAGEAAVTIAYYAFFSLFPLLLVFVSILGFVLQDDPAARASIVRSALRQFPIIGAKPKSLMGSGVGLGVGLVGTLWSGLGVTLAVGNAFYRLYAIPPRGQPNVFVSRWRGLKLLGVVGVLQILSTVAADAGAGGFGGWVLTIAGIAVALALNLVLFFVVFRFLIPDIVPTRELWPRIVVASVAWETLQALGGLYVAHVVKGREPDIRHVRRGDQPARVALSRRPDRRLRRRDQRRPYPRPVAAKHHGPC